MRKPWYWGLLNRWLLVKVASLLNVSYKNLEEE